MSVIATTREAAVSVRSLLMILGGFIFLAVGTSTMVNVALPSVGAEFHASESAYGWVLSGYMLTFGVFSSVYGRLADRFGLRRMYLFGVLCFSGFALVNAAAPNLYVLIAARTLQGAGATALPRPRPGVDRRGPSARRAGHDGRRARRGAHGGSRPRARGRHRGSGPHGAGLRRHGGLFVSALPADTPPWLRSPWLAEGAGRFSNVVLAQGLATLAVLALVPLLKASAPSRAG